MPETLFQLYKQVLLAHIETKTTEPLFHEKSEEFYNLLFEAFHTISEKRQDLQLDTPQDCETNIQNTYNALEEAKGILTDMVNGEEKQSV